MALKSKGKFEKAKAFQDEEEEFEESSKEEDELSPLSRRVNHLQKKKQTKFIGHKRIYGHVESTSGQSRSRWSRSHLFRVQVVWSLQK